MNKAGVDAILNRMAIDGKGEGTIKIVLSVMQALFGEAVEGGYIEKNPTRRVTLPRAKPGEPTRSLSIEEARCIMDLPQTRWALMYRVMLLTGARIGEVLALTKADIILEGLVIDESALQGKPSTTKNRKTRTVVLSTVLRRDLEEWAAKQIGPLIFPREDGSMDRCNTRQNLMASDEIRQLTGIADLTPRMCRTTFATLFDGDPRDLQDLMGHWSVDLTMNVYRRPIATRQQAAIEEYEARLTGKVVEFRPKEKVG